MVIYFGLRSGVNKVLKPCLGSGRKCFPMSLSLFINLFSHLGHKNRQCVVFSSSSLLNKVDTPTCHYPLFHFHNHFMVNFELNLKCCSFGNILIMINRYFTF